MSDESNGTSVKAKPLTRRQRLFIQEFLVDLNATKAYRRVYTKVKSDKVAGVNAAKLLGIPSIQAALATAQAERAKRVELSAEWVVRRLKEEADWMGKGSCHGARVQAIRLLGLHLGLFTERVAVEQGRTLVITERIISSREEAQESLEGLADAEDHGTHYRNGDTYGRTS